VNSNTPAGGRPVRKAPLAVRLALAALAVLLVVGVPFTWPLLFTAMSLPEWGGLMKGMGLMALAGLLIFWPSWFYHDLLDAARRRHWLWGFAAGAAWAAPIAFLFAWYVVMAR
jgi:hypothetical protein